MKKLLIAGAGGYIGSSFVSYLETQFPEKYELHTISVRTDTWKSEDFSGYDSFVDFAGIAHIQETEENAHLYYEVNRDLALALCKKAKDAGVRQFIYLSSMSVYGLETGRIDSNTLPAPVTHYGKSKLEAEQMLATIASDSFKIAILRPPMVYGDNCKGNYAILEKIAESFPFFPSLRNQRSAIHIDRLCAFLEKLIENEATGLFFPQDESYMCTSDTVWHIAQDRGRKLRLSPILNVPAKLAMRFPGGLGSKARKAFGNLIYDQEMSTWAW